MHFLKKGVPFILYDEAQWSLDVIKHTLTTTPLLHPLEYTQEYILYFTASTSTIGMVLVQEDDDDHENVIYYLNKSLLDVETRYSHIEKLNLEAIIAIQIF